ncbi:MAG: hypothetical protein ACK5BN_16370, partial [Planctomycetota bacterium]
MVWSENETQIGDPMNLCRTGASVVFSLAVAMAQSLPPAEYQVNSAPIALSLNGMAGDAYVPASDVAWIGGQASVMLEVGVPSGNVTVLAYELGDLVSASSGAYITPGGQIINMAMGATFVSVDVSAMIVGNQFVLQVPTSQVASFAFQALVTDSAHPDGFRVSAPAVLQVTSPTGVDLSGSIDLAAMASNALYVVEASKFVFADPLDQVGAPSNLVSGVASLTSASVGQMTRQVEIDGDSLRVLCNGVPVASVYDLFPVSFNEIGVLRLETETPVSMIVAGMYLAPPLLVTHKTDAGKVVKTISPYPVQPGQPPVPTFTSAQANAQLEAQSPGITSRITEVAPPDPAYWCHGYTFLEAGTNRGIYGRDVPRILSQNGYQQLTMPPEVASPGDVAIYKAPNGDVLHSGVVSGVSAGGVPTE